MRTTKLTCCRTPREHGLILVTSDVTDFGDIPIEDHAGLVLLYDDTMPAYRVAAAPIALVDASPERYAFRGIETLDAWM